MKVWLVLLLLVYLSTNDDLSTFQTEMENKVKGLAKKMEKLFARRCNEDITDCQVKSWDECIGTSEKTCFEDFPKAESCLTPGAYLSQETAIRFPKNVNTSQLTAEDKQFVCTSALMEDTFKDLDDGREKRYGRAYVGSYLGSFRSYPASRPVDPETQECTDYDPRYRPWYTIATSGAKNVILMIDVSGSMDRTRLPIAK